MDIIDLLSSDNEAQSVSSGTKGAAASMSRTNLTTSLPHANHSDHDWAQIPSKRRKLGPPLTSDNDACALPSARRSPSSKRTIIRETLQEDRGWATLEESDPIVFTSSLGRSTLRINSRADQPSDSDLSDDSFPDDLLSTSTFNKPSGLSARTSELLDSLSLPPPRTKPSGVHKRSADVPTKTIPGRSHNPANHRGSSGNEDPDTSSAKVAKPAKKPKLSEEEKAAKARLKDREKASKANEKEKAKAASKELKAKEKEEDQERKRLLKEEKARDKRIATDLAEVNKSKLDKKDSTPEMIVDLPASIDGQSVNTQIREFLKNLDVDATLYQSPVPNVIRWRRKMKARWNTDLDHWEPLEHMEIHEEKHVLCIMSAKEFIALAMKRNDDDMETHVATLKSAYDGCIPIYLVEGLHLWMRKNKTAENRAYQAQVHSLTQVGDLPSSTQPTSRKKKPAAETLDEDLIEDALLRLQVMNGCLVHHTSTSVETAEWVVNFTQHISTIPYRTQRMNLETTFCMESGQVRTGEDKDDTFVKMLQEVVRITPPIAYGIASEYSNVATLVEAFRRDGPNILEDLQKSANRNGALTDRKIGPAISRRLYKVFMELDPASTDV